MRTGPFARTTSERRGEVRAWQPQQPQAEALTPHRPTDVVPVCRSSQRHRRAGPGRRAAPYLTTADAARYCGFKTPSAIRKAHLEGRVLPVAAAAARAPGCGPSTISTDSCGESRRSRALLPFRSRNAQVRLPRRCTWRSRRKWKLFKGSWISTEPVLPRVWQRKEGGHVVRARVLDRSTGRQQEIWKVLAGRGRADGAEVDRGRVQARSGRRRLGRDSEDALLRLRDISLRAEGRDEGDQERKRS